MVKPRLNTIDQVNELIAHGAHAIDVDLVKELLQIISAQPQFNFRPITEKSDHPVLLRQYERHYVTMIDDPKTSTEYIPAWIP